MQALYQLDVQGSELLGELALFFVENSDDEVIGAQAYEWTKGTWEHIEDCDEAIVAAAIKWEISRLSFVDKSILRLSVYQLKFCRDVPPKVVINEAIELAKKYSTAQSPGFVNGVLDAVLRRLETAH